MNSAPKSSPSTEVFDPVTAYDRLAPYYSQFSNLRSAYLRSVDDQVEQRIPSGAKSLLDIGAGDGNRATRIAGAARISRVFLLEPSSGMSGQIREVAEVWPVRAEELDVSRISLRFDAITCLWNVLGHIKGFENRARAMNAVAQLLSPSGLFFVDVIHRYNLRSYGMVMTAARWVRDQLAPGHDNGDVVASWETAAGKLATYGHVFTDREMRRLAIASGLELVERIVIDYATGQIRKLGCSGNLLYVFRRSSRIEPSSAAATS